MVPDVPASLLDPTPLLAAAQPVAEAGQSDGMVLTPWLVLALSAAAAIGTIFLLPGKTSVAWRRTAGGLLFAVGLILVIVLLLGAGFHNVYFWAFATIAIFGSVRVITHPQPVYSALYFVLTVFATAGLFVIAYAEFMAVALITIYAGAILVTYTFVIMLAADAAPEETGPQGREEAAKRFLAEHDANARSPIAASIIGFVTAGVLLFAIFERAPDRIEKRLSVTDAQYLVLPPVEGAVTDGEAAAVLDAMADADETLPAGAAAVDPVVPERRGDLYVYQSRPAYAHDPGRGGVQVLGIYLFTRQTIALQVAGLVLTVAMIGAIVIARRRILEPFVAPTRRGLDDAPEEMTMPFTPVNDNPHSLPVVGTGNPRQKAYPQN
jgi:NADH-quinone oxidoreductase subunit J